MEIKQAAVAGTLESSDVQVSIYPSDEAKLEIQLKSIVEKQFGESIVETAREVLEAFGITRAIVSLNDKGALDWVIRSRIQAACCRATASTFPWKEIV